MNVRQVLFGSLLLSVSATAAACELPALIVLPPVGTVDDLSALRIVEMQRYVAGIRQYTACVQADLAAAGGDAAPESVRSVLIRRNNGAVAEAKAVIDLFGERVAPVADLYLAEFISGDGDECIAATQLESTGVVNDMAVLLIERGGRTHLNVLEASCPNLERYGEFEVRRNLMGSRLDGLGGIEMNSLCSREFIYPYEFNSSQATEGCGLGRFFKVTDEQAARLLELGNANRQPETLSAEPAAP